MFVFVCLFFFNQVLLTKPTTVLQTCFFFLNLELFSVLVNPCVSLVTFEHCLMCLLLLQTNIFFLFVLPALAEKFSDIFFLLDGGLSSTEFGQVRNILVRLSNQLKVGASAHRLGLAFYGQDTRVEFFLNSYQTKEDIQSKIKKVRIGQLQPNEKRNLGNALEQARTRFLIKEAGSRADQGYQQYLVVFSGQDSNDDVDRFSHLIKSEGVTVAGVSLGVSSSQMKDISTPGYYFQSNTNLVPSLKSVFEGQEQAFSQTQGRELLVFYCLTLSHPAESP